MITLPRDLWTLIRSFSGDTGYEPTPTARLMRSVKRLNDDKGLIHFPGFGRDGYASTVFFAVGDVRFLNHLKNVMISTVGYVPYIIGHVKIPSKTHLGRFGICDLYTWIAMAAL